MTFWLQRLLGLTNRRRPAGQPASEGHAAKNPVANTVANPVTTSAALDFPQQLARSTLERRLEAEVGHLRQEVQQLRAEVVQWALEVRQLKVANNASPMYAEAVTLAQQGVSTAHIADRCGISFSEAELVVALVQSVAKSGAKK